MATVARPSAHPLYTKSHAIDQMTDPDQLRAVAHRMWEAFSASHWQTSHMFAAVYGGPGSCEKCALAAAACESEYACDEWHEKQKAVTAGFGSV